MPSSLLHANPLLPFFVSKIVRVDGNSSQAKNTVKYILKQIFHDKKIQEICQQFSRYRSRNDLEMPKEAREELVEAMKFLFDITSSVSMLPPLDDKLIEADADGKLTMGLEMPHNVMFAMGRYCDTKSPDLARTYPDVSALVLQAWDAEKEKLALDSFFVSMGGYKWSRNRGWRDVWVDLGDRFGVTTDKNGHVIRIHLASNNLQGKTLTGSMCKNPTLICVGRMVQVGCRRRGVWSMTKYKKICLVAIVSEWV